MNEFIEGALILVAIWVFWMTQDRKEKEVEDRLKKLEKTKSL